MITCKDYNLKMTDAIRQATAGLKSITATARIELRLISAPFAAVYNIGVGDLTYASGNGLDPITSGEGNGTLVNDGLGHSGVALLEPAGGFNWVASGVSDPVTTVYGIAVVKFVTDDEFLFGVVAFDTPIVVDHAGQFLSGSSLFGYTVPQLNIE